MIEMLTKIFQPKNTVEKRLRPRGFVMKVLRHPAIVEGSICTLAVCVGDTALNSSTGELFRIEANGVVRRDPYRGGRRALKVGGNEYLPAMVTGDALARMDLQDGEIVYCSDDDWLHCASGPLR